MSNGFFDQFNGSSTLSEDNSKSNDKKRWGKQKRQNKSEKKKLKSLDGRLSEVEQKIDDNSDRLSNIEGFLAAAFQRKNLELPEENDFPMLPKRRNER